MGLRAEGTQLNKIDSFIGGRSMSYLEAVCRIAALEIESKDPNFKVLEVRLHS